jgi:hypothetical protein
MARFSRPDDAAKYRISLQVSIGSDSQLNMVSQVEVVEDRTLKPRNRGEMIPSALWHCHSIRSVVTI